MTRHRRGGIGVAVRLALAARWRELATRAEALDLAGQLHQLHHQGRMTWGAL